MSERIMVDGIPREITRMLGDNTAFDVMGRQEYEYDHLMNSWKEKAPSNKEWWE